MTAPTPSCSPGESAAGQYPVEAVKMQASIAMETERHLPAHRELKVPEGAKGYPA